MKISNYLLNTIQEQGNDFGSRRLNRLEKHRERLDQTFDRLQQQAIEEGDSEKAQKIFEISEMIEDKLDTRLDKLEKKMGEFNWSRHLDNAFDKLQVKAYENEDAEIAESAFSLSQVALGGKFDSSKQVMLERFLTDSLNESATKPISSVEALSDGKLQALLRATETSETEKTTTVGETLPESNNKTSPNGAERIS